MSKPRYDFAYLDINHEVSDEDGWRMYEVQTHGDTAAELLSNMTITSIDQDGGEIKTIDYLEASPEIRLKACQVVQKECEKVRA